MKRLFPLYFVIFLGFIAYSIQIPIFTSLVLDPNYGPELYPNFSYGMKRFMLGFTLSMYPLGQFFGSPILGALSDRFGRKKILLISLCFTTLFTVATAWTLMIFSLFWLHFFLFIAGLFEGNIAIAQGSIVDSVDDDDRSRYFGYIYICSSTGFILGPLLASFLSNPSLAPWFGPSTTFWFVAVLLVVMIIWLRTHYRETHNHLLSQGHTFFNEFTNLGNIFRDRHLRYYYGVNFLIYFAIFGYLRIYPIYLITTYHPSFGLLSLIIAYVALPFIVVNLFFTPLLSSLHRPKRLTLIFAILMGLAMISIVLFRPFYSVWITLAITTFALAITKTFSVAMISFLADKENQGAVMGNNQSLVSGAQAISAFAGGIIAIMAAFLPLVIFGLLSILAGILLLRRRHHGWKYAGHEMRAVEKAKSKR